MAGLSGFDAALMKHSEAWLGTAAAAAAGCCMALVPVGI